MLLRITGSFGYALDLASDRAPFCALGRVLNAQARTLRLIQSAQKRVVGAQGTDYPSGLASRCVVL